MFLASVVVPIVDRPLPVAAAAATGSVFVPTAVDRVFDTRDGTGGVTPAGVPLASGVFYDVVIPGCPAATTAIALNVTAAESAGGFVAVYAGGTRAVTTSLLNPNPGGTRANFTLVPVGAGNTVTVYSQRATHLLADRFGCMVAAPETGVRAGRFVPADPLRSPRVVDTREPGGHPFGPRAANSVTSVRFGPGYSAVALNVTVDQAGADGWLGVAPGGTFSFLSPTSNVNYRAGEARAAFVIVPLADDGSIDVAVSQRTDVIIDVAGYFTDSNAPATLDGVFIPQTGRLLDSRPPSGTVGKVPAGTSIAVPLPPTLAPPTAMVLNYTADDAAGAGYLSGWSGLVRPLSSNLNYRSGETSPNSGITPLIAPLKDLKVYVGVSSTAVIVDETGYFVDLPVSVGGTTTAAIEDEIAARINQARTTDGQSTLPSVRLTSSRLCALGLSYATIAQHDASESSPHEAFHCAKSGVAAPAGINGNIADAIGAGTTADAIFTMMQGWRNDPAALLTAASTQLEVGCAVSDQEAGVVWCTAFLYQPIP